MSTNQFSSEIPKGVLWTWQNQQPPTAINFHSSSAVKLPQLTQSSSSSTNSGPLIPMFFGGNRNREAFADIDLMFEKVLTPSDVGKLNRLVIPKLHAETHFPLGSFSGEDMEKGMSLMFEDELGKFWRFRYSYWNSSQSYVLTRGWSRFVKEKQLDAGDIVTFHRAGQSFYIGWRRRFFMAPTQPTPTPAPETEVGYFHTHHQQYDQPYLLHATVGPAGTGTGVSGDDDVRVRDRQHNTQTTSSSSGGNPKRSVLRLFGVNMECHEDHDQNIHDGSETLIRPDPGGHLAHAPTTADQQRPHHPF